MIRFFDKIYSDNRIAVAFFFLLSCFFYIGLGHVHLFDWDEINFAESAREMIESGDYLRVQINYLPFWEKPPLFFWLQVVSMKLFGINEFAARFPNAIFGFLYLITFFFIGKKHFNARFGLIWALVFFGSLLPHLYFKSGIIDPVFNYFIFLSIYFLLLVVGKAESSVKYGLLSGVFSACAVLTKGPVGFLLLALTFGVFMLLRKFKGIPHLKYFILFLLGFASIVSIWLVAEYSQNGIENMWKFIEYQLELFNSGVAGHEQPFYYHFVVVFFGCFPISILALPALRRGMERIDFDLKLWMVCLFWVVMILFSITTTKIIHYSSMTYVPLSFLATLYLVKLDKQEDMLNKWIKGALWFVGIVISIALIAIPLLLWNKTLLLSIMEKQFAIDSVNTHSDWTGFESIAGVIFLIGIITALVRLNKREIMKSITILSLTMASTLLVVLFMTLPKIERMTQGPAIYFYSTIKEEDCYIETFDFKSYAQYFYSEIPFREGEPLLMDQLVNGEIDKPVYLVTKSDHTWLEGHANFNKIDQKGGYKLFRRDP